MDADGSDSERLFFLHTGFSLARRRFVFLGFSTLTFRFLTLDFAPLAYSQTLMMVVSSSKHTGLAM
jgi:hypothetical protein